MRIYFGIGRNYSKCAFGLRIDYCLQDVHNTLQLNEPVPTPPDFLSKFSYEPVGGTQLEDMLANNMGWRILSPRLVRIFGESRNAQDVEFLSLPQEVSRIHPELQSYRVLGIKRQIFCVDLEESDILWSSSPTGAQHISSFRECVLVEEAIPPDVDVFMLGEYPMMPIISAELAMSLANVKPSGFVLERIRAVKHQP